MNKQDAPWPRDTVHPRPGRFRSEPTGPTRPMVVKDPQVSIFRHIEGLSQGTSRRRPDRRPGTAPPLGRS